MLKKRVITTLIGLPLLASAVQWGGKTLFVCIIIITLAAALMEFLEMTAARGRLTRAAALSTGVFVVWLMVRYGYSEPFPNAAYQSVFYLVPPASMLLLFYLLIHLSRSYPKKIFLLRQPFMTMLGVLYISLFLSYLILIYSGENGKKWIFYLLIVLWCSDIGAYIAGKAIGKRKLAPLISPHKTIEGALGGVLCGILAALCARSFLLTHLSVLQTSLLALTIAVWGQAGDLCESALKRYCGVKDSGAILPGHGGMLDRIDSLLFTAPIVYYIKLLLN